MLRMLRFATVEVMPMYQTELYQDLARQQLIPPPASDSSPKIISTSITKSHWLVYKASIHCEANTPRETIPECRRVHAIYRNKDQLPPTFIPGFGSAPSNNLPNTHKPNNTIPPPHIVQPKAKGYKVHIVSASGLHPMDVNGHSDPYCVVWHNETKLHTTKVVIKNLNPQWSDEVFEIGPDALKLKIHIFDKDLIGADEAMGTVTLGLPTNIGPECTLECPVMKDSNAFGTLVVKVERIEDVVG